MAKRGRKAKPAALKILGNERSDRLPSIQASRSREAPAPPAHLDDDGLAAWHRIIAQVEQHGGLDASHVEALSLFCTTYSRWRMATEDIKDNGITLFSDLGGVKTNPACGVAAQAERLMAAMLVEFGLTPASRARVKTIGEAPKDALAEFLAKKKA